MKAALLACVLALATTQSYALNEDVDLVDQEGRTINLNFNTTGISLPLILGATLLTGVIALLIVSTLGSASSSYYNRNDYDNYDAYAENGQYGQYRSAQNGFFDGMNIVQWISMLQDVYEKFDYNDLDCQKRLICEVMREPDFYGTVAQKFKTGFQYAKYLEVLDLPDDMRELLDEYMDANSRADQQKSCDDFFTCPYSIKDSMKRNIADTNNL